MRLAAAITAAGTALMWVAPLGVVPFLAVATVIAALGSALLRRPR